MPPATFTVLMSNYNHAHYLPDALQGIVDQSRPPDEIIVLDDGSTDDSVSVLQRFAGKHPTVRIERNPQNRGVLFTMNRLFEMAQGDYVIGMAADDRIMPGFFEKSLATLARFPKAAFCSSLIYLLNEAGDTLTPLENYIKVSKPCYITPRQAARNLKHYGIWVHGNSVIYNRALLEQEDKFAPELGYFSDGFMYQVLALRHGACFVPERLACWRISESGYSSTMARDQDKLAQVQRNVRHLMKTKYTDLFPPRYVACLEWNETTGQDWAAIRHEQDHAIAHGLTALLPPSFMRDRVFPRILVLLSKLQTATLMAHRFFLSRMSRR